MAGALLLLLLLYGWHAAAAGVTTPARLVEGRHSIERLLRIPQNLPPGRYEVLCEGRIRKQGRTNRIVCYYKDDSLRSLVKAVRNAASQARYVPARRDGVAADVYMTLMVRIDTTTREPLILAVPNNGVEATRYGPLYTAPQRFNEFDWDGAGMAFPPGRVLMWEKIHIDEHGKVLDYDVTNVSDAPAHLIKRIGNQIQRMDFMPGYTADGKPVPMLYVEALMN